MNKAFSLIEMLVVLAVLGIALGLGMPSIQAYVTRSQLSQSAEELAGLVKWVGAQALSSSESHEINLPGGPGNTFTWGPSGTASTGFKLNHGVLASCTDALGTPCSTTLDFGGRGLPASQYNLTVLHRGKSQKVVVLLTGKVVIPR